MSETGKGEMREIYGQRERPLTPLAITQTGFIQQIPPYFSFPLALSQAAVSWSVSAEDQKEYLTIIRDESRRLADLATNILMLNRVESQTILTDKQSFALDEQLRQSVLVTQQRWRHQPHHPGQRSGPCHGEKGAGTPRRQYPGEQCPRAGQLLYGDAAPVTGNNAKRSPDTGCPVPGDLCLQNSDHSSKLGSSFRTWISSI